VRKLRRMDRPGDPCVVDVWIREGFVRKYLGEIQGFSEVQGNMWVRFWDEDRDRWTTIRYAFPYRGDIHFGYRWEDDR